MIDKFETSSYDSVLSVCSFNTFWWHKGIPLNYDPLNRPMRQERQSNDYFENGAIYGIRRSALLDYGCRIGKNPLQVETSFEEGIDIDTLDDLKLVEMIIRGGYEW